MKSRDLKSKVCCVSCDMCNSLQNLIVHCAVLCITLNVYFTADLAIIFTVCCV